MHNYTLLQEGKYSDSDDKPTPKKEKKKKKKENEKKNPEVCMSVRMYMHLYACIRNCMHHAPVCNCMQLCALNTR